jgi:hypothetical protein
MAHRVVLTERQRTAIFSLATDGHGLLRHYTLADDDLAHIQSRRRPGTGSVLPCSCAPSAILDDC